MLGKPAGQRGPTGQRPTRGHLSEPQIVAYKDGDACSIHVKSERFLLHEGIMCIPNIVSNSFPLFILCFTTDSAESILRDVCCSSVYVSTVYMSLYISCTLYLLSLIHI